MSPINSLHSFFRKISRPATIAAITVITLLFFWLINFQGVPGIPPIASLLRIGLPDMMFTYSPSSIYEKLTQFGADGRSAYRIFLERVDFLFPAVYGLFFVMVTTFGFSRLFPNRPALQKLSLLPWFTTLFDYAENLCFFVMLRSYPEELPNLQKLANVFTLAKWTFAAISIVLLLVAILGLLIRNLRRPASA
jgi:hypothetical protein